MATLSTAGWVVHDLGLAAALGGNVFGKVALDPTIKETLPVTEDRSRVLRHTWRRQGIVMALAHLAFAVPWFIGRRLRSGRELGRGARRMIVAKDVCIGTALASGIARGAVGRALMKREDSEDSEEKMRLIKAAKALSTLNLAAVAGAFGLTTILAMCAGQSATWSTTSHRLP
jgi:hypothetical protein